MITHRILTPNIFTKKVGPCTCGFLIRKFSGKLLLDKYFNDEKSENLGEKKLVKVAILGRPNAGKSTLINRIVNLNLCDVSSKTHTTRGCLKTAFIEGNTQILFVDTPGLVTEKEYKKFKLEKSILDWRENIFENVDVIGIVHYSDTVGAKLKFQKILMRCLQQVPDSKPMILLLNKIDLLKKKTDLLQLTTKYLNVSNVCIEGRQFAKVFLISALNGDGVSNVVDYLLSQAKPGDWVLDKNQKYDVPDHKLICSLVRGKMMDILPEDIPYKCQYEVEYLERGVLDKLICVVLMKCESKRHRFIITRLKSRELRKICQQLEEDFFNIFKKVFHLRVVVVDKD